MAEKGQTNNGKDMTVGRPAKLIFLFAVPLMLGNMFQQIYTLVDALIVSRLIGVNALAAVGSGDWYTYMILVLVQAAAQGFSIKVAQYYGAGDYDRMRNVFARSVRLSILITIVLFLAAEGAIPFVLHFLNTPAAIRYDAALYIRTLFLGIPFMMLYNMTASMLRAVGDSRSPLVGIAIASAGNIVLDLLFVAVFHWGLFGAAFATALSELSSGLFCLWALRRIPILRIHRKDFRGSAEMDVRLLQLAMPLVLSNMLICIGGLIVASVENTFGVEYVAGYTATNKLYSVLEMAAISYGFAMVTYVGQNYGAGDAARIRRGYRDAVIIALATSALITAVCLFAGKGIISLFITDTEKNASAFYVASLYLKILSIPLSVLYILHVTRNTLTGLGDTLSPMISGFVEFVIRAVMALAVTKMIGSISIMLAEPFSWAGADVVLIFALTRQRRRLKRLEERRTGR